MKGQDIIEQLMNEQPTVAKKKQIAKALGVEYKHPSIEEQIAGNGKVAQVTRSNAKSSKELFVIPEVCLINGRVISSLQVDPAAALATANELLRLVEEMKNRHK
jgi:hypothetical protein